MNLLKKNKNKFPTYPNFVHCIVLKYAKTTEELLIETEKYSLVLLVYLCTVYVIYNDKFMI